MRNKRRTDEEWLSLIQQCRSSGFSDRVWCEQNDISINTFYNTVTRLRKKSCMIPETDRLIVDTSEAGAGASAVMYSIEETAKANNLNICKNKLLTNINPQFFFVIEIRHISPIISTFVPNY